MCSGHLLQVYRLLIHKVSPQTTESNYTEEKELINPQRAFFSGRQGSFKDGKKIFKAL